MLKQNMRFSLYIFLLSFNYFTYSENKIKTLGVLIFPGFETLDVFGPLEMFGSIPDKIKIITIAQKTGLVASTQGTKVLAEYSFASHPTFDMLLVPGGFGVRNQINNVQLINWLRAQKDTSLILSVCTGSALLAKAQLLNNRKATTNKKAFAWVITQGKNTTWLSKARWVDDGNIITSSGVAAGLDMSLYVIKRLYGTKTALKVANDAEYDINLDANNDKFASKY